MHHHVKVSVRAICMLEKDLIHRLSQDHIKKIRKVLILFNHIILI